MTDIEIAKLHRLKPIREIAKAIGIPDESLVLYGNLKAKFDPAALDPNGRKKGKLILVTAMTPTSAGEGKTTTTVGLTDALNRVGVRAVAALREPSLGPVFGMKGGATGGGYSQVAPMEDINLHFTGDFHAIGAANNLLAAMIDNHIHHGNRLGIALNRIAWRRCVDMNDRQLRNIVCGLGGGKHGLAREDGFDITVASEVMAVLCLSDGLGDLKRRLSKILVGYTADDEPVTVGDLRAQGAMAALLRDAIKPNLVQTLEHSPAILHGGPFANIAHGCNSVVATRAAMALADYAVTEAGFGADLGAEKFVNIKCRSAGIRPDAVVLVATVRALRLHGGAKKANLAIPDADAVSHGLPNLIRHIENIRDVYRLPCVVAINLFPNDSEEELQLIERAASDSGAKAIASDVWARGGAGGVELAEEAIRLCDAPSEFEYTYPLLAGIREKLSALVTRVYRGAGVALAPEAVKSLTRLTKLGYGDLPICMAKTQYSFSDDPSLLGAPTGFTVTIRDFKVMAGAGFVVALSGDIMTMPGLPSVPSAEGIDVDENGSIVGLF